MNGNMGCRPTQPNLLARQNVGSVGLTFMIWVQSLNPTHEKDGSNRLTQRVKPILPS